MQEIIKKFNQKYTKTIHRTRVSEVDFHWEFCGFFEIINLNNLITFIEVKLKITYNKVQEDDLREKITQLRALFDQKIAQTEVVNENILTNYLLKMYTTIRDFINSAFFIYILYNYIHSEVEYKHQFYDVDDFYELCFSELQVKTEKLATAFWNSKAQEN